MRLLSTLAAAVMLAALALAACNSTETKSNRAGSAADSTGNRTVSVPTTATPPGHVAPSDGVKRITTVELREALDQGKAIVVDVRADAAYQANHIKGSIHIPVNEVQARLSELPRDKMIVTYCS